jgi:hypothetical protein
MNSPQFLITSYLESNVSLEELRKQLFEKGVFSKDYVDEGLMLLYHKFDSPVTNDLERECRSLVIDRETRKIVSYSCETPLSNKDGVEYLVSHLGNHKIVNECFEGTYLSVFNHNNKWYVSTRRCLDSSESLFNQDESHFQMFEDVLNSNNQTFEDFCGHLDMNHSYYFVLIHHKNKHVIDYTNLFGPDYKKLCLTTIRNENMLELFNEQFDALGHFASTDYSNNIFIPRQFEDVEEFAELNRNVRYDEPPTSEGVVVRICDPDRSLYRLIKLQYMSYQFGVVVGTERNIFKGLIYLYQNDKLVEYFNTNQKVQNIKKIVNPLNTNESYDTIGMVDAVFKVCTSELFELFKVLWNLKNGEHLNKELYEMLPKEYKDMLFAVRGIYYKKKALLHNKENVTYTDIKTSHLKINDIYNHLKSVPTDMFVAFLRMRRLMFNWVKTEQRLVDFSGVNKFCDKVHIKLAAIFTNKLFPNIMPTDVPPQKEITFA